MKYPNHLNQLIQALRGLPGVGNKSAERFAFDILSWSEQQRSTLATLVTTISHHLQHCQECGCLIGMDKCTFCDSSRRDPSTLCLTASVREVFAIEATREYHGMYHVLGGTLSPLEGRGPEHLSIPTLKQRLQQQPIKEIVIALDSTLEGDATALYLQQELASYPVKLSRLAFGIPMGSSLDYVDGGTLTRAFLGRREC